MKQELDEYLCKTYPKMMVNRNLHMTETAMCWGFECGDGWFDILRTLMGNIQHRIDWNNSNFEKGYTQYQQIPQVTLDQVKEKFGTLRFYYSGGDDYISGMVAMAESMSAITCETCGKPGTQTRGGWIKTACKEHGGIDYTESEEDYLKQGFEE